MKIAKKDELLKWVQLKGIVSSVDVRQWGLQNCYIRADRTMRALAEVGERIKRLMPEEIESLGLRKKGAKKIAFWVAL